MATARIDVRMMCSCGCGFHSGDLEEAYGHVDKTGHTIGIVGEIRGWKKEKYKKQEVEEEK